MLANICKGMSIINLPSHVFASFGHLCKYRINLKWIFLNDLATILLEGNKCCMFANLDQLQYLPSRICMVLSSSLKKLFTSQIPPPLELWPKQSDFAGSSAGHRDSENFTMMAMLDSSILQKQPPCWIYCLMQHLGGFSSAMNSCALRIAYKIAFLLMYTLPRKICKTL